MSIGEEVVRLELRSTQVLVTRAGDEHFVELICPTGGNRDAKVALKMGVHLLANVVIEEGPDTVRINNHAGRAMVERVDYRVRLELVGQLVKDADGTMYTMQVLEEEDV